MIRVLVLLLALPILATPVQAASEAQLWQIIKSGEAVAMMRHALAPGTGDPANFAVEDCTTQRNLDEIGRVQSKEIGKRFEAVGISQAKVLSSAWCRCWETAELLGLGDYQIFPALNSFFRDRSTGPSQIEELRKALSKPRDSTTVWVTHQVNITGLTGVWPDSGEIIVIRSDGRGGVTVAGRIATNPR